MVSHASAHSSASAYPVSLMQALVHLVRLTHGIVLNIEVNRPPLAQIHSVLPLDPAEGSNWVYDLWPFWTHLNRGIRCGEVRGNSTRRKAERLCHRARLVFAQLF
jgi:hypothetical protein